MAYCTYADLKKAIPEETLTQLTDDAGAGYPDQAAITDAIRAADAVIDANCSGRYTVPLGTVPEIIQNCSVDLAIYNLYSRRVDVIPQTRIDRNAAAIKTLGQIAKGEINLPGVSEIATADSLTNVGVTDGKERIMGRDNLEDF